MADLTNLPVRGVPGTHLSVRHAPDAVAALRASIARQNLTVDVDAVTGDVTLYLNALKTTYLTFSTAGGATQLVVLGVDRGSLEGGLMGDKDPQESVLDRFDPTAALPAAPTAGDRYIATATANGWTDTYIYTYNSAGAWDEFVPTEGALLRVEDENKWYSFDGSAWVLFETDLVHALLSGLQGGTTSEYFHLTEAQHAALTILALEGVLDRFDPTAALPVAPADWDAYIATATANGWADGNCYVYDGSAWVEIVSTEGLKVWVADEDRIYVYTGVAWALAQAKDAGAHDHGAATAAGASHNHVFAGTALPTTNAKVDDNAGAAGGNLLYVDCTGANGMFGYLNANNAVAVGPEDWELADGSLVLVDHNGAPKGYAVNFDKDLADGERFRCNNTRDGKDIYVPIATGLLVKFVHEAVPSGIAVSFDDGAVADIDRCNSDFTGAADAGDKYSATDDDRAQYGMVAAGTNAAEATHTHVITGEADHAHEVGSA